jgi:hypothetical protein
MVVEFLPRIALGFDLEVANALQKTLTAQGMIFHLGTKVSEVKVENGRATATATKGEEKLTFDADKVLVSVGRRAFAEGVGADRIGVELDESRELYEPSEFERNVKAIDEADHRGVIQGKDHGFEGNLGLVIGAGGGSLTLTDAVRSQGGKPANYSEIGGNPSVAKACGLAKEVLEKDGVEKIAVMMSIVSNTRVDIVARGVIKACLELDKDPGETIAIFRIPGAWEEEGFKILEKYGVEYADRSVSLHEAARRAVVKIQGAPA